MNKPSVNFSFQFVSDGIDNTIVLDLATDPIFYNLPTSTSGTPALNGTFLATATAVPDIGCDGGLTVMVHSLLLGVLTVKITAGTQVNGQIYNVNGTMVF